MNMESPVEWKEPGRSRPHRVANTGDRVLAPENIHREESRVVLQKKQIYQTAPYL